jgi:hypothetical protein
MNKILLGVSVIGLCIYTKIIGKYTSKPYVSSIRLEPSEITTKLNNDGLKGI